MRVIISLLLISDVIRNGEMKVLILNHTTNTINMIADTTIFGNENSLTTVMVGAQSDAWRL